MDGLILQHTVTVYTGSGRGFGTFTGTLHGTSTQIATFDQLVAALTFSADAALLTSIWGSPTFQDASIFSNIFTQPSTFAAISVAYVPPSTTQPTSDTNTIIAGAVGGGAALLFILVIGGVCYTRSQKKARVLTTAPIEPPPLEMNATKESVNNDATPMRRPSLVRVVRGLSGEYTQEDPSIDCKGGERPSLVRVNKEQESTPIPPPAPVLARLAATPTYPVLSESPHESTV